MALKQQSLVTQSSSVITKIQPAVKDSQRVNIFLDQKFSFSLTLAELLDAKLQVGQTLSFGQLQELKSLSQFGKLYQRALERLTARPFSVKEMYDYLRRKQFRRESSLRLHPESSIPLITNQQIEAVIAKLLDQHYLDDYRFATYYLEHRRQRQGISQRRLKLELLKKGISQSIIQELLDTPTSLRQDCTEIQKLLNKKRRLKSYDQKKLIQYLVRQGFDYELAQNSVLEMDSQN